MTLLVAAQTLFYFTVSLAIIVLGVLCAVIAYYLMKVARNLRRISDNLGDASDDVHVKIEEALENLASIPFLSAFMSRGQKTRSHHKRSETNH
ncbi:MAG: hypothetical protein KGI60_04230 [Patescibacteria group bacterium]|nr:hypothetical protein [Patescibacteria group bacterium]